jgi:hypothetical protein
MTRPSEAVIVVLPVIPIVRFDPDGREQRDRERAQAYANRLMPPPRTMPLLVIDNDRVSVATASRTSLDDAVDRARRKFDQCMLRMSEALNAGDNLA